MGIQKSKQRQKIKEKVRHSVNVILRLWKLSLNPMVHQDSMGHWARLNTERMDVLKPIHE